MDAHLPYRPPKSYKERHCPDVDIDSICQKAFNHNAGIEEADFRASEKLYNAEIDYLDDQLGRLFDFFREEELLEDTVFLIVSDHGENLGEEEMFGHQFSVSESLVHVPLMVRVPGEERERIEEIFELKEIYNYLPSLAGIEDYSLNTGGFAKGGYEYPELDLRNIPSEKHDELGRKLIFVRDNDEKLVREGEEDFKDKMIRLGSGEEIEVKDSFREQIEDIGKVSEGRKEIEEEEVKERLKELGYM